MNFLLKELRINHEIKFNVLLPLGISFYTFQEISYIVDVYKNPDNVQKDIFELGLYIAFFPQLIAGPIVRYNDINVQIETRKESLEKFYYGTKRFIIGLSKKVLLANNFARICDNIYDADFFCIGTLNAWIAAFSYSLQIYYDFSGYSDMAIGLASMFGFDLQENFNYPYSAISITDFWKRWHISLTSFFRDYVYIPLGGNRNGTKNTFFNRFAVFFLTGLWHGASINFILWGILHGALMSIERILKLDKKKTGISSFLYRFLTLIVILFLWVLFRNGTKQSVKLWLIMFGINYTSFKSFCPIQPTPLWFNVDTKIIIIAFTGIIFSFPWWKKIIIRATTKNTNLFNILEIVILTVLLGLCFAYLAGNAYNPFIYFRF